MEKLMTTPTATFPILDSTIPLASHLKRSTTGLIHMEVWPLFKKSTSTVLLTLTKSNANFASKQLN
ncbi:hypothetical protein FAM18175_02614 [Lacticaseibacillus paracasei]|nr:hypothetical protein FAM18175_02614 [Lacticaseibacillus paracasei]